ncbi:MAG: hypothetical protein CMH56_05000 [Myxococcales bacterium]|nr:hypothetical protein [Myxococcales bacterium]
MRVGVCLAVFALYAMMVGCNNTSPTANAPLENVQKPKQLSEPSIDAEQACEPACDGRECGSDLCGGLCGECASQEICAPGGVCEPAPEDCTARCEDLGYECGEVCGETCGTCEGAQDHCLEGNCVCQPDCVGRTCGDADGCGGTCTPCPVDFNCSDCAFKLSVVQQEQMEDGRSIATLALAFNPTGGSVLPVMADLQMRVTGPATLSRVGIGQALLDAGKEPLTHPHTGAAYQRLDAETYRFMVLSTQNTRTIGAGQWLFFKFEIGDTATSGPATFGLLAHPHILAPMEANLFEPGEMENAVVIWPEVSNAE